MRTLSSLLSSLLFCVSSLQAAEAIVSRDAQIDNVQLHYLTAGHGSATVILLHGFAETSRMWRPIIPLLAEKFTVIAPDLPGIGDSSIPAKTGMLIAAQQIHELVRSLKIEKARVVGHDIGLMVAYAYAAQFPNESETMPVLSIGGEKSLGNQLGAQMKLVADNVTVIVLQNAGHWILEEKPKETTAALLNFL